MNEKVPIIASVPLNCEDADLECTLTCISESSLLVPVSCSGWPDSLEVIKRSMCGSSNFEL